MDPLATHPTRPAPLRQRARSPDAAELAMIPWLGLLDPTERPRVPDVSNHPQRGAAMAERSAPMAMTAGQPVETSALSAPPCASNERWSRR